MKIEANSKLLFIGDSITSGARDYNQPGEGNNNAAYGDGYVRLVKSLLDAVYPQRKIRVINKGIGGHTIRDLAARWRTDVLDLQPDWLSVMIGINDVWRHFDCPLQTNIQVGIVEYGETYRRIVQMVRSQLKGLVIVSPYVVDSNRDDAMRKKMDQYSEVAKQVASEFDAIYVDIQKPFDEYLRHYHPNQLCWDRIHPISTGHMLIARAWLNAVGFEWQKK